MILFEKKKKKFTGQDLTIKTGFGSAKIAQEIEKEKRRQLRNLRSFGDFLKDLKPNTNNSGSWIPVQE